MASAFTRILVDVDASVPAHPALERAAKLARACGATLTVVDVWTVPPHARRYLPSKIEEEMIAKRREQLARLAAGLDGLHAGARLLMGRPGATLIQEVIAGGHDLLVRSHVRDLAVAQRPYGAIDMELLRECPRPLLLVGPGAPPSHPRILGAVNASVDGDQESSLNDDIVALTLRMAELEGGTPLLMQAWTPFGERTVRAHLADDAFAAYAETARQQAAADLAKLADTRAGRLRVETVLRRGEPEDAIPDFVVAEAIDLVVMGTVARSGLARLLIGNTAERVLRKLACSVLAIKPAGFGTAGRLDPS